jgi:hypothetical protein
MTEERSCGVCGGPLPPAAPTGRPRKRLQPAWRPALVASSSRPRLRHQARQICRSELELSAPNARAERHQVRTPGRAISAHLCARDRSPVLASTTADSWPGRALSVHSTLSGEAADVPGGLFTPEQAMCGVAGHASLG